jgi:hypothetical protein
LKPIPAYRREQTGDLSGNGMRIKYLKIILSPLGQSYDQKNKSRHKQRNEVDKKLIIFLHLITCRLSDLISILSSGLARHDNTKKIALEKKGPLNERPLAN